VNVNRPPPAPPEDIEEEWEKPEFVHVFPLFGREHVLSLACWCHPSTDSEQPTVILHNVEN